MKASFSLLLIAFFVSIGVNAKVIQILHTNDLHSYFDGTRFGQGGYARLKTTLDKYKKEASDKGIQTFVFDAGDFGEGSTFFFSNDGVDSLKALDLLGIDVTVLGNHDFMQGGKVLAHQIEASGLKAKILSANLKGKNRLGLKGLIESDHIIEVDGKKIYLFGLTTAEAHYMYPIAWKGFIRPPLKYLPRMEKKSIKAEADFVIALTHIGLDKDIELVTQSSEVDLVIGGHSHTRLENIHYAMNSKSILKPIVQTGAEGMAVGRIMLDLKESHQSEIISYELIDVTDKIQSDEKMQGFVANAKEKRSQYFNRNWDEVIGFSNITLSGFGADGHVNEKSTCWGKHLANLAQSVANTDIGIHPSEFEGEEIQPGPIRFGDIIDNYPHFRNFNDGGWEIVSSKIQGWVLKKILSFIKDKPDLMGINITGITWPTDVAEQQIPYDPNYVVNNILIRGEKIRKMKYYSMAYPSEVAFALRKMIPGLYRLILPKLHYTREYYWPLLENYFKENSPITCDLPLKLIRGKHH